MKEEVGSDGFTDDLMRCVDRIARLLAAQHTQCKSKKFLLSLFMNFAKVKKERSVYLAQIPSSTKTRTVAWADGYLTATRDSINLYLEKRFSLAALTLEECEMIVDRNTLKHLFEHGPNTDQTAQTDSGRTRSVPAPEVSGSDKED
jgi:hypothetical protein